MSSLLTPTAPPVPKKVPRILEKHGHRRTDDYYWLRDRNDPEVIAHLEAENAYTEAALRHTGELQERLYEEIISRIPQRDESVPYWYRGYYYYSRYEEGAEYPLFARRRGSLDGAEELLVDGQAMGEGEGYFSIVPPKINARGDVIAFATDTVGRRIYTLRFRDLSSGAFLPDVIEGVTENFAWANDGATLFYSRPHPETLRWYQVWRHRTGTDPASDVLVYEETDETFDSVVYRTKSEKFLVIHSSQTIADESRILEADRPEGEFRLFEPRRRGHEYAIDHHGETFFIRTNDGARNFRIMRTPDTATTRDNWSDVVGPADDTFIEDFEIVRDGLVLIERRNALTELHVIPWEGEGAHRIAFDEPAYVVRLGENASLDVPAVRFVYTSMTTPASTFDYDIRTRARVMLKRESAGPGFDPSNYVTERLWANARDGIRIPVTVVYRRDFRRDGTHPLYLHSYGSYGISTDPIFNSAVISLLDRGFVHALPHIRGGQELGREWYEGGKLLRKKNTFTDFIDAADFLVREKYADPKRLFAAGGSAGGLLVGAVVNLRPELFRAVVARVPFVDVVTTMLDDDLPLTTAEYDEWGDPNEQEFYQYILSYSPYDQIEPKEYPNILVTTGLHDSQVQYWEPAKWVAKLRAMKTGNNVVLLKTEMEAGHGGASGRFRRHRETALIYAFLIDLAGS
jgi:oligopeptidase B